MHRFSCLEACGILPDQGSNPRPLHWQADRDLFKKIRDTKGIFHAKMGSIKDRNCMDLTEADDIKKRWQEYTEEHTKKIFTTQIIMMM